MSNQTLEPSADWRMQTMNKLDSITELAKALAKFQGEIKNPSNTAANPYYKSKYAPLNDVLNLVRPLYLKMDYQLYKLPQETERT